MSREKELKEEVEAARGKLREEIKAKEREADERLDTLLSPKKMEFCPQCGRKINSRSEWGGRCLHEGCEAMVCIECWASEEKRFCGKHSGDFVRREEPTEDEVKSLTLNYMEFIEQRMKKHGLDWTPEGFIRKSKTGTRKKKYRDFEMVVYEKHLFSKRPRLGIIVKPVSPSAEADANEIIENVGEGMHAVIVFVGSAGSITTRLRKFAEEFSNKKVSLFMADMEGGNVHFNRREKITEKYSYWFDPTKTPLKFADILKTFSESVAGRRIVSVKDFAGGMGLGKDEAASILRKSGLLEEVKGADSYILKE